MGSRDLTVRDDSNHEIEMSINDPLGIVTQSTLIAETFGRALVKVVSSTVRGSFDQVIVEFGNTRNRIELQLHSQRLHVKIQKMNIVVEECSAAVLKAEASNKPQRIKDEWVDRLYGLMYKELSDIAPSGKEHYE